MERNKINLASGQRPFKEGWTNLDIRDQGYAVDILSDMRSLPMIPDNSVDVLVCQHGVEHLDMSEVGSTAREWHRVLKSGGKLVVCVPNIKELIKAWLDGRIDDYIFNVNVYGAYQGHLEDLHRWSYYYEYLVSQMSQEGVDWSQVKPFQDLDRILNPIYLGADISFDWWILSVEFTK